MTFSLDSAFYVFNLVANFAYSRWDVIYADVHSKIIEKETTYATLAGDAELTASKMFADNRVEDAVEYLTSFSVQIGDALLKDWFTFFGELFVKYRDGYITVASAVSPVCGCSTSSARYQDQWYDRIVSDTGDHYVVPEDALSTPSSSDPRATIPKQQLRAFQ